jgi:peroxiredoxin
VDLPLPENLPTPQDDGAADHLPGAQLPDLSLPATDGSEVELRALPARTVLFIHPSIGGIDAESLDAWTAIPGARGCTPEACGFRDVHDALRDAGANVLGLSGQTTTDQRDAVGRLHLPYPLLSDTELSLAQHLRLPTFEFEGRQYFKRITLVVSNGTIEAALYPVFPPDQGAEQALAWLSTKPA